MLNHIDKLITKYGIDFYQLTKYSLDLDVWPAWQYDKPATVGVHGGCNGRRVAKRANSCAKYAFHVPFCAPSPRRYRVGGFLSSSGARDAAFLMVSVNTIWYTGCPNDLLTHSSWNQEHLHGRHVPFFIRTLEHS